MKMRKSRSSVSLCSPSSLHIVIVAVVVVVVVLADVIVVLFSIPAIYLPTR